MIETGSDVMIAMWVDPKGAAPKGRVIAERSVGGRRAYAVRHTCGKLRTWYADELLATAPGTAQSA